MAAEERGVLRRFGVGTTDRGSTDERERIEALAGLRIAGTPPEAEFDGIAALAARIASAPWAVITFVDDECEWVKAAHGRRLEHVGRRVASGARVVERNDPLVVDDTAPEPALQANPWLANGDGVRFYAGVPLRQGDLAIGTLAVLDREPRTADDDLIEGLTEAATVLAPHLARRRAEAMAQNVTSRVNFDGCYVYVSPAVEQVLGWRPEEMVGRPALHFMHPDDAVHEGENVASFLQGEITIGGSETRFRTKDGGYRWLHWTAELAPHEGVFYTAAKDITDRKRNEIALRESEARYRMLAENATDMVTGHQLDGTLTYVSSAARPLTGWKPDDLIGHNHFEFVHPEDRSRVEAAHRELLSGSEEVRVTSRVRCKDGSWLWVEAISRLVRDRNSAPVGLQTSTRDISETKAAAEALDAARGHFQRIFDDAPVGMAIVDLDGHITRVNASYCRALGYSENELTGGIHVSELLHPDEVEDAERLLREVIENDDRIAAEKRHLHKDGHVVWMRSSASGLTDADGTRFLVATVQDVTDERLNAEELQRAREEAERANRAKSEFLSRMSHELRTPLNAVLGFAQLLESDDLAPNQRESIARILRGGYHLLNLVNDVLDMSAIESGQLPIAAERVCATDSIEETVGLMRPLADERSIRLSADLPATKIALSANEQRLKQVLLNLTSNAIKYSPSGADVTVRAERDNGTRARIHVIDTGPGIPADEAERVFMPFARLSTAHKIEGTGLGLALSRSLVEGMGGSLTFDSSHAGSTFTVDLPLAGDLQTTSAAKRAPAEWTPEDDERLCRILYIEDNEDNVAVVDRLCHRRGDLELHSAARGDAGLELARRLYPDAILLDLHLPDTTADKVIAELRADDDLRDTPVIVVTADVTQDHEQRLRAAGATAYLTKPLDLGRLQQELDRALGG